MLSVLSKYYVKDYTRIILNRIKEKQTFIKREFVGVGFKGIYEYNKNTGNYDLRRDVNFPAIAGYLLMDQEEHMGLGLWATQDHRGVRDNPLFVLDIWAKNRMELDLAYSIIRRIMFQEQFYFQSKGIRDISLYRTTHRQYDAGDRIVQGASHVTTRVQRLVMLYRLKVEKVWDTTQEGIGTIGTIIITDTGVGETVTWTIGGGFADPLILDLFNLSEDNIFDLGVF
nr:MAG: hypothetical protein [Lokiarchaeota virus Ratatoskr Meg22_1012]